MRYFWALAPYALFAAIGCHTAPANPALVGAIGPDTALMGADIRRLAGDEWEGRGTGTAGNDSAAAFIARRYQSLGLQVATRTGTPADAKSAARWTIPAPADCSGSRATRESRCALRYLQPFVARSVAAVHAGLAAELPTQNVVALIRGTDPALRGQLVVLGAHFDHLGRSSFGAQDPEKAPEIHNGADDNASGTVAVMELARLLKAHPTRRSVALVNFSGEELGLLGSQFFVDHPPFALDSVQAMLNFDMVGRLKDDKLLVYGVATAAELPTIVQAANTAPVFRISAIGDGFGPSDHSSFYGKNVPVLHFFTDVHDDYHRVTDDADKINLPGMARVVAMAERITRELGDRPARLTFQKSATPVTSGNSSRTGSQAYLGSIPDMGATDVVGMRLSSVRAGSPADQAGIKAGDVIVEFGGAPVKDLYTYSDALYGHQPGDVVAIVVLRGTERLTFKVTLGKRG